MTEQAATNLATSLLATYGYRTFELSMSSGVESYRMKTASIRLGRDTGPVGDYFMFRVSAREVEA